MNADKVYAYKGHIIKISQDVFASDPREDMDNAGVMVCFHRRYNLGDKHDYKSEDYSGWDELEAAIRENENAPVILPLYLYDHSGITMYTTGNRTYHQHAAWDSEQVGFIYLTRETIVKEWGYKRITKKAREFLENYLRGEIETYDYYLRGEVYGNQIYEPDMESLNEEYEGMTLDDLSEGELDDLEAEELDSCWGFYGLDYCKQEAESMVDYYVKSAEKNAA